MKRKTRIGGKRKRRIGGRSKQRNPKKRLKKRKANQGDGTHANARQCPCLPFSSSPTSNALLAFLVFRPPMMTKRTTPNCCECSGSTVLTFSFSTLREERTQTLFNNADKTEKWGTWKKANRWESSQGELATEQCDPHMLALSALWFHSNTGKHQLDSPMTPQSILSTRHVAIGHAKIEMIFRSRRRRCRCSSSSSISQCSSHCIGFRTFVTERCSEDGWGGFLFRVDRFIASGNSE